jgi:hypothetical protein
MAETQEEAIRTFVPASEAKDCADEDTTVVELSDLPSDSGINEDEHCTVETKIISFEE